MNYLKFGSAVALSLSLCQPTSSNASIPNNVPNNGSLENKILSQEKTLTGPDKETLNKVPVGIRYVMTFVGVQVAFSNMNGMSYMQIMLPGRLAIENNDPEFRFSRVLSEKDALSRYAHAVDRILGAFMIGFDEFSMSTHDSKFNQHFKRYHPAEKDDTPQARKSFFADKYANCMTGLEKDLLLCAYFDVLGERIK